MDMDVDVGVPSMRANWPYVVGAIGGGIFGFGAAALVLAIGAQTATGPAVLAVGLGAILLGVAWLAVLKQQQGGFGAVVGSFGVPLALIYMYTQRDHMFDLYFAGTVVAAAFACFALGHVFASGLGATRFVAAATALVIGADLTITAFHWEVSASTSRALVLSALGGLALIGFGAGVAFLMLRKEPPRQL